MQLFFDIDGVLLNFERAFVRFLNDRYGMDLSERYETPSWFFEELLTAEEMLDRWEAFLESGDSGNMDALVEPERFNGLVNGHRVHLLTNFPAPFMEKRRENLANLGIGYDSLHHCGLHAYNGHLPPSKAEVIDDLREKYGLALFVDDHPENCLDVLNNCENVEVWLMSRYFNRDFNHPRVHRAEGWPSLIGRLTPDS